MDFFDLLDARHSTRSFLPKKVEEAKLQKLQHAANRAPSAGNLQAYKVVAVKGEERKEHLAAAALGQSFVAEAPLVLVFVANLKRSAGRYSNRGKELYAVQDATIACCYVQLAAQALGLASVWVGAFDEKSVASAISAGSGMRPVAILPLGYAAEKPFLTRRLDDSFLWEEEEL